MKKYLMVVVALLVVGGAMAQEKPFKEEKPMKREKMTKEQRMQRYESMKIAHLTKDWDLSPEQAQSFWPVYNKYADQKKEVRKAMPRKNVDDMTDEEAEAFVEASQEAGRTLAVIDQNMMEEMKGVLSPTQRAKLLKVEKDFHKDVVKRFTKRKKRMKRKGRHEERGSSSDE